MSEENQEAPIARPLPADKESLGVFGTRWKRAARIVPALLLAACSPQPKPPPAQPVPVMINPEIPAEHEHMAKLIGNAFQYLRPEHGMIDPASGYPLEGWNDDPSAGLFLRSFTQVTAIGEWIELLANIAAGQANNHMISQSEALDHLEKVTATLRKDQQDPTLAKHGLLVNFLGIEGDRRIGPLAQYISRKDILEAFGQPQGTAIWNALIKQQWIKPEKDGAEGRIQRSTSYGHKHFTGAMQPFAEAQLRDRIMNLLDERVVLVAYGDNANLTTSVAKAVGALLRTRIKSDARATAIRDQLEAFLDAQAAGYKRLVDAKAGLFSFGRNESRDRFFGWNTEDGTWIVGHQDCLVNEFRDPTMFVVTRYGLSRDLIGNLGFKIKSVDLKDGRTLFTLAPYSGAAFQAFGLDLGLPLLNHPAWKMILENAVAIELDYANHQNHPGFLSESYTGDGTEYSGDVGIPQLAVTKDRRITLAPSLYTLGTAYQVAPDKINAFLGEHWNEIEMMLTEHGPWEGFEVQKRKPIEFQTTAHTLSLILGALGNGPENMQRYIEKHALNDTFERLFQSGSEFDLLSPDNAFATWAGDGGAIKAERRADDLQVTCESKSIAGIIVKLPAGKTTSLSGGLLKLHYTSDKAVNEVMIKMPRGTAPPAGVIPNEILTRFKVGSETLEIPLPTTPALEGIKSVEINFISNQKIAPLQLTIYELTFQPLL